MTNKVKICDLVSVAVGAAIGLGGHILSGEPHNQSGEASHSIELIESTESVSTPDASTPSLDAVFQAELPPSPLEINRAIDSASALDLAAAFEDLRNREKLDQKLVDATSRLFARWVSLSPEEVVAALSDGQPLPRALRSAALDGIVAALAGDVQGLSEILRELPKETGVALLEQACHNLRLPPGSEHDAALGQLTEAAGSSEKELEKLREESLTGFVDADPKRAWEWAGDNPEHPETEKIRTAVIGRLVKSNPEHAVRLLSEYDGPIDKRDILLRDAGTNWIMSDFSKASNWLAEIAASDGGSGIPATLVSEIAKRMSAGYSPADAARLADVIPADKLPEDFLSSTAHNWLRFEPNSALAWIRTLPEASDPAFLSSAFGNTVVDDSNVAAEFVRGFGAGLPPTDKTLVASLSTISRRSLDAGLEAISSFQDDGSLENVVRVAALSSEAKRDPASAVSTLATIEIAPEERAEIVNSVSKSWATSDFESAVSWALNLDAETRDLAIPAILKSGQDPIAAGELALEWLQLRGQPAGTPDMLGGVLADVATKLSSQDFNAAIAWNDQLPESLKPEVFSTISDNWAKVDPVGLSESLASMPPGAGRDIGIVNLVNSIPEDPERTIPWALAASSADTRNELLASISHSLRFSSFEQIHAMIGALELSPANRQLVETKLNVQ